MSAPESPSPPTIDAAWQRSAGGEAETMTARIFNNSPQTKVVLVDLVGRDPYDREVARSLGTRTLAPKSTLDLSIPVRDLPVQSAGHPSTATVAVTYDLERHQPDGTRETIRHKVHSAAAYVTFSDDFRLAAARTVSEQARLSRTTGEPLARGATLAQVKKLRHYNARYDRIDELPSVPGDAVAPPLLSVSDETPGLGASTPSSMKGDEP